MHKPLQNFGWKLIGVGECLISLRVYVNIGTYANWAVKQAVDIDVVML